MEHVICRKFDSLLEGIYNITNSEKITSRVVHEIYTTKNVFKPCTYYLGTGIIKNHHSFIVIDTNGTYIVTLKVNDNTFEIHDLGDVIDYTISYISAKESISIVGEGKIINISVKLKEWKYNFIWS